MEDITIEKEEKKLQVSFENKVKNTFKDLGLMILIMKVLKEELQSVEDITVKILKIKLQVKFISLFIKNFRTL